jgi:hypothetical protein
MPSTKKVAVSPVKKKQPSKAAVSAPKKKLIKTKEIRSTGKVAIKDSTTKKIKKEVTLATVPSPAKAVRSLAIASPFRFPIDIDKVAVRTARYGGVFFVVMGAIFTLLFADDTINSYSQVALVGSTTQTTITNTNTTTGTTPTVDPKPKAQFIVNNPQELKGTVQVKVKVPYAHSVRLSGYNRTAGEEVTFGTPTKVSDDTWEMYVDTTHYDDGEYKFKALITNQFNSYESVGDGLVTIKNTVDTTQTTNTAGTSGTGTSDSSGSSGGSTSAGTTTTSNITTTTLLQSQGVALTVDRVESDVEFRFEISVPGADRVKVYTRDTAGVRKLVGYGYKSTTDLWKYKWVINEIPAGEYGIHAEAEVSGSILKSNVIMVRVIKPVSTTGTTQTTLPTTAPTSTTTGTGDIAPSAELVIDMAQPLKGIVPLRVNVRGATSVEIQILPKNALTQRYLGLAKQMDSTLWQYRWDSTMTPNGEYKFIAFIKNAYGAYTKESSFFKLSNPVAVTYTEEQRTIVDTLTPIITEETKPIVLPTEPLRPPVNTTESVTNPYQAPLTTNPISGVPPPPLPAGEGTEPAPVQTELARETLQISPQQSLLLEPESDIARILSDFRTEIETELQKLAAALRIKDENKIFEARERINGLKKDIANSPLNPADEQRLLARLDSYLREAVTRVEEDVVRIEKVITERSSLQAQTDSDKDGVTDYDELALYSTDPFSADSDGDGFNDGSEILKGFDPKSSASESAIAYESPKEIGVIREDLFKVDTITAAAPNEGEEEKAIAIITGKGLPNSFVTLYIFSTPVVVTLKTDQDGNWNYRFDKELDDGEHQVYVGVTDNAGKIVAKSEPFTFVKEAQAFTPTNAAAPQVTPVAENAFNSQVVVYTVLSISVVAIGLVLILLGIYLDSRQKKMLPTLPEASSAV